MARIELFARTEIGCVRERNEDAFVVANITTGERGLRPGTTQQELERGVTLVGVCDGMGGAAAQARQEDRVPRAAYSDQ